HSIEASTDRELFKTVEFELGETDSILGTPLTIPLSQDATAVRISYSTTPGATALQWLDAEQTFGKKAPFLFTQSQEIHARSWIPLQDTPGVRVTYSAIIETPNDLLAVMSDCRRASTSRRGSYQFEMTYPIPPYLIALAVGDIAFASTGPRTGVYAELSLLEAAKDEFAEADRMLQAAERLYGNYLWDRFDILVLPPSFPFGGMENPGVTFVTPTLITGDRSSVSVIAHELAHAWSGNLVTNATWSDFWLNEGFTTYTERRIQEELYGSSRAAMEEVLAEERLAKEMKCLPPEDQLLHPDLKGRDPEATLVPYVKGALFLKSLENTFGRARFDAYLRSYFEHFAFKSITTAEAIDYLRTTLLDKYPELAAKIPLEEWLCAPGLPDSAPKAV
ncbi:MAG TPA: M1 family aminopeptidase/hydrolase, partial [Anaerolineales bacterium]|nr:M1 family aminopeptidase/hydrolase [Anaerolineales bacterium]